ncbi:MAG: ferritin-like domain-containing protein [Clostridia bacterium]|jgi:bacterioferritin|nr:ferritin-like domain-containing protein [Clostridia bacterium]
MDTEQIIKKLNWFYSLEKNQVELYLAQSKRVNDIYLEKMLERASTIEQGHVENISRQIERFGGTPTLLGDVVSPILGKTGGQLTASLGVIPMLKADMLLEQKAMSDYKDFIMRVGHDEELFDLLWSNLIDEDLHTSWFAGKIEELENRGRSQRH